MKLALPVFLLTAALIVPVIPVQAKTPPPPAAKTQPTVTKKAKVKKSVRKTHTARRRVPPQPVYPVIRVREAGC